MARFFFVDRLQFKECVTLCWSFTVVLLLLCLHAGALLPSVDELEREAEAEAVYLLNQSISLISGKSNHIFLTGHYSTPTWRAHTTGVIVLLVILLIILVIRILIVGFVREVVWCNVQLVHVAIWTGIFLQKIFGQVVKYTRFLRGSSLPPKLYFPKSKAPAHTV